MNPELFVTRSRGKRFDRRSGLFLGNNSVQRYFQGFLETGALQANVVETVPPEEIAPFISCWFGYWFG